MSAPAAQLRLVHSGKPERKATPPVGAFERLQRLAWRVLNPKTPAEEAKTAGVFLLKTLDAEGATPESDVALWIEQAKLAAKVRTKLYKLGVGLPLGRAPEALRGIWIRNQFGGGKCAVCRSVMGDGESVYWRPGSGALCFRCAPKDAAKPNP